MQTSGSDPHQDMRDALRALCAGFPDTYHRDVDTRRAYPEAFVDALTKAGWLAALIPQEYGGSGLGLTEASVIMEEINRCGGNSGACHGQMYNMGTLLRHGSEAQKQQVPAGDRQRRVAPAVDGRDRAHHRHRHHQDQDHGGHARATATSINGQKVWISRVQHSDLMILLARTTPLADVQKKSEGMSIFIVDLREAIGNGMTVRPIANMVNHETNELFFDNLEIPGREPDRRGRQGLPVHPRRPERRAHPDRRRVHRRRLLVHRQGEPHTPRSASCSAGRSARTRACSSRSPRPTSRSKPPT